MSAIFNALFGGLERLMGDEDVRREMRFALDALHEVSHDHEDWLNRPRRVRVAARRLEEAIEQSQPLITIYVNDIPHAVPRPVAQEIGVPAREVGATVEVLRDRMVRMGEVGEGYRVELHECKVVLHACQAALARLRGESAPHESGDQCIGCERLATEEGFPYCDQCLLEGQLDVCCEDVAEWYGRWWWEKARKDNFFKRLYRRLFGQGSSSF